MNTGYKGITPACAGIRPALAAAMYAPWDHPRVRGDKAQRGSFETAQKRITPACAGIRFPFRSA